MRSLTRTVILASLLAMLLPAVAYAAGPFYLSTTGYADGDGSAARPLRVTNSTELTAAGDNLKTQLSAGEIATVYWINTAANEYAEMALDANGVFTPVKNGTGTPPGFGVPFPPPLIVGGLIALGILLIGTAWLVSRRLRRSASSI